MHLVGYILEYADGIFVARLNTADCGISRYAAAMYSALLFPAV